MLPRLADEDELDHPEPLQDPAFERIAAPLPMRRLAVIVAAAVVARLGYLFFFTDPENAGDGFTDAYHHWQIAYLTKEIGLSHGPRLWDMRGWEYFWGPLHPALMNVVFFATGSIDIVLARLLSLGFGAAGVALIFMLCHRYWGVGVATAAAAFAAFSPVAVFNDTAGMAEPIAIALMLLGIWLAPRHGFWGGLVWAIAAMARVEAWLLGFGLVVSWLIGARQTRRPRAPLVVGWLLGMGLYAKFLFDNTGNPIYPLFVNFRFVGLAAGGTSGQASVDVVAWVAFMLGAAACVAVAAWVLWRRPPSHLLLVFGFGYTALSLATYLRYVTEWKERRFEFPLDFAAILVSVAVVAWLPRSRVPFRPPSASVMAGAIAAVQLLWVPIASSYASTQPLFSYETSLARQIGAVYHQPEYRGAVLNMPGDEPTLLYALARNESVPGDHVVSQFYDPFYYLPAGYTYAAHRDVVGTLLRCWLAGTQTRLWLLPPPGPISASVPEYKAYIADQPQWFTDTGPLPNGWSMVAVAVPVPPASECSGAAQAVSG